MASSRLTIQNFLVTLLQSITTANGYNNNVQLVTKRIKDIEEVTSFPELSVIAGSKMFEIADEQEELFKITTTFAIVGYLKSEYDVNDSGKLNDDADRLIEDIETCLLSDNTIYNPSNTETKTLTIDSDTPIFDYEKNWATVTIFITIVYFTTENI